MQSRERSLEGFKESSGPGKGLLSCIAKEILFNMVKIKQMEGGENKLCGYPRGECSCRKEAPPVQRP